MFSDKEMLEKVWATIVALAILERKFGARKDEFDLISKKAKTFLKKQGIKENLADLISKVTF